jgi:hypothetical protein
MFNNIFLFLKSCRLWDNVGKNMVEPGQTTDDNIIRRIRIACWITEVTVSHSEYVTLTASPLQQRLHERSSVLRYTYFVCLISYASWQHFLCGFSLRNPPVSQKITTFFTRTLHFSSFWVAWTRSQSITDPSNLLFWYFTAVYSTTFHLQYLIQFVVFIKFLYTGLFIIATVRTSCVAHLILRQNRILCRKNNLKEETHVHSKRPYQNT